MLSSISCLNDTVCLRKIVLDALRQLASTNKFKEIEKEHAEAENDVTQKDSSNEPTVKTDATRSSGAASSPESHSSALPEFSAGQSQPSGADLANSTYVKDFSRLVVDEVNNQSAEPRDSCKSKFSIPFCFANSSLVQQAKHVETKRRRRQKSKLRYLL